LYKDYLSEKIAKEGNQKYYEILHDKEKFETFIEEIKMDKNNGLGIFRLDNMTLPSVEIKQEYILYVEKYGLPTNNVWDPDKLASIKGVTKTQKQTPMALTNEILEPVN